MMRRESYANNSMKQLSTHEREHDSMPVTGLRNCAGWRHKNQIPFRALPCGCPLANTCIVTSWAVPSVASRWPPAQACCRRAHTPGIRTKRSQVLVSPASAVSPANNWRGILLLFVRGELLHRAARVALAPHHEDVYLPRGSGV